MKWMTDQVSQKRIEEVPMKWTDRQISKKKWKCHWNWSSFIRFFYRYYITFDLFQWHFHVFCTFPSIRFRGTSPFHFWSTWSDHPFHGHFHYKYKTKCIRNKEQLFTQIELLNVCLLVDPNYPNNPNHPNYPNHLGLFETISITTCFIF